MNANIFTVTFRCTEDELNSLRNAWKSSDSDNRSQFIKNAINCYSIMNKNAEEPIFKITKAV